MRGIVLLCIGGILIAVGLSLGGTPVRDFGFWPWNNHRFPFYQDFCEYSDDTAIRPVDVQQGRIPARIRNLVVDLKFSSLEIHRGAVPEYRAIDFKEDSLQVKIDGDTLVVEETDWQRRLNFKDRNQKSHLEIILPKKVTLDDATISIGAGSLTITGIDAERLSIESAAGSIKGAQLHADEVALVTGAGSLNFSDCSFDDAVIQTGAGRVQYDGAFLSRAAISTGAGSVELNLDGSEDDYRIDFTRGIGSVKIGRSSYNGIGNGTAGNPDADRRLDITSGVGSVRIRFKD